jgi:hypothetical protein
MSAPRLYNMSVSIWNVRGLGDDDKCTVTRSSVSDMAPAIMCLHETKLTASSCFKLGLFLPRLLSSHKHVDAVLLLL